jgi:hypothetical protein
MTTRLRWTRDNQFTDHRRGVTVRDGEGVYDVPDDAVDDYLDHPGWEEPEDTAETSSSSEAGESEGDSGDNPEDDSGGGSEDEFDAEAFVDDTWQSVMSAVEDGEADEHLNAVREAEQSRDGGPREGSVMEAIAEREEATDSDTSAKE